MMGVCVALLSIRSLATPPAISSIFPQTLTNGSSNQPLVLLGSNFESGAVVLLNGSALPTTFATNSTLGSFLSSIASGAKISVRNPDGTVSNAITLSIQSNAGGSAPSPSGSGFQTWYVRPDGGTRYSSQMTTGQCDGLGDVAYPGSGVNQHCAFKDVRLLWQDGSHTDGTTFPGWGWIGKGGDTYLIRGSIGTGVTYRIGWNNGSNAYDSVDEQYWGLPGDPYDSGIPMPPSGTDTQHTRILGENYAACSAASAKTQLHGGYGVLHVLDMTGVSYVDLQCLDITDFSDCSLTGSATKTCNKGIGTLTDFASIGIEWSNTSTHDSLTNVHVHGLASDGMNGPSGDGDVFSHLDLIGNASSGWNADAGNGTTGSGSLLVQNFNISWNGCAEEYPTRDALPYFQCADDASGGYGDGFGTTTLISNPGWQAHFDQGVVSYNTQDGLDALHLRGSGSSMTVTRTLAFGNMGQQIKIGGQAGTAQNNVIVTNCNAMRQAIPGTPSGYNNKLSDYCRAADTGIALTVGPGTITRFDNNTILSASTTAVEVDCDTTLGACDGTSRIDYRNNLFVGFPNDAAHGYVKGGSNDYSNPIYDGTGLWPFGNAGSYFSNNLTYHAKSNWTCPKTSETKAICGVDPRLRDESWHLYGSGDTEPLGGSAVLGAGAVISGILTDFDGSTRPSTPAIGAYEKWAGSSDQ